MQVHATHACTYHPLHTYAHAHTDNIHKHKTHTTYHTRTDTHTTNTHMPKHTHAQTDTHKHSWPWTKRWMYVVWCFHPYMYNYSSKMLNIFDFLQTDIYCTLRNRGLKQHLLIFTKCEFKQFINVFISSKLLLWYMVFNTIVI